MNNVYQSYVENENIFEVTEDHIKLLRNAYVSWYEIEFGAPAINGKRPYGNSDVFSYIARILEIKPAFTKHDEDFYSEEQEAQMLKAHKETVKALQIFLVTGEMKTGTYKCNWPDDDWVLVN